MIGTKNTLTKNAHLLILLFFGAAPALAQAPDAAVIAADYPTAAGVYFKETDSAWTGVLRAAMVTTKTRGLGHFMDTDGLSGLNVTVVFAGAKAPLQMNSRRPVFFVRRVGLSKDALIVRLTRKKDSRETQTSSNAAAADNRGGFIPGDIYRVIATPITKDSFKVEPETDLKQGEYLLVFGGPDNAFDFGIKEKK